jgi:hypothetical protein
MRSKVFAYDDRLLGRCLVKGNSLGPIVALQLCLFMLFGGWAGSLGDLALRREVVYVPLPWNEVSFYVARVTPLVLLLLKLEHNIMSIIISYV